MSRRSATGLVGAGARFVGLAMQGRAALGLSRRRYLGAVWQSLRPHYFPLAAGASLTGSAAAPHVDEVWRVVAASLAAGSGWGVGQLVNDLMDTQADAVDAPERPAVLGLLPEGPTIVVAAVLGLGVAAATVAVHPRGYWLALLAAFLLLGYGAAKRTPVLGNLAHGALIATAAAIGRVAATPQADLAEAVMSSVWVCLLAGAWAAAYLQSNYEKDRLGDVQAACRTLAHLLGLRASAALRLLVVIACGWLAWRQGAVSGPVSLAVMATALFMISVSATLVMRRPTEAVALRGYRFAVHGAVIGMLAMGAGVLGDIGTLAAVTVSVLLTERAFRRDPRSA